MVGHDSSWQVLLADLSLILFLSTAAALAAEQEEQVETMPLLGQETPVAQHRLREGGPTLGEWLAEQPDDPRLRLTLVVPFEPWYKGHALDKAERLAREARMHDKFARVIVEPGDGRTDVLAVLAYEGEVEENNQSPESGTGLAQ